jgi:hypothetical protein
MDKIKLQRETLLAELINNATDPVKRMRRARMLSQLSMYESQIIKKIAELETDDVSDFLDSNFEIDAIVNRNA